MFLSINTVKRHVAPVLAKLNVTNQTQATAHARELGLLEWLFWGVIPADPHNPSTLLTECGFGYRFE